MSIGFPSGDMLEFIESHDFDADPKFNLANVHEIDFTFEIEVDPVFLEFPSYAAASMARQQFELLVKEVSK